MTGEDIEFMNYEPIEYIRVLNNFHFIHMVEDNTWVYPGFPMVFAFKKMELHFINDVALNDDYVDISSPEELRQMILVISAIKS